MFHKEKPDYNRKQYGFYTIDELVPKDHFLRQVDSKVDFDFIYDLRAHLSSKSINRHFQRYARS